VGVTALEAVERDERVSDISLYVRRHVMSRTFIDVDDRLLRLAADELGTTTKKDTVNEALRAVAARAARRRLKEMMKTGAFDELSTPEFENRVWE
jgi:Arc/MetJ family transcription regulator